MSFAERRGCSPRIAHRFNLRHPSSKTSDERLTNGRVRPADQCILHPPHHGVRRTVKAYSDPTAHPAFHPVDDSIRTGNGWNSEGNSGRGYAFRLRQRTRSTQWPPEAHDALHSARTGDSPSTLSPISTRATHDTAALPSIPAGCGSKPYFEAAFFRADFFFAAFLRAAGLRAAAFFRPAPFTLAALRFLGFGVGISSTHLPSR